MKKKLYSILLGLSVILTISACKRQDTLTAAKAEEVPQDVLSAISKMGLRTNNVYPFKEGYIVEGDIYVKKSELSNIATPKDLVIAKSEQYRTSNLVTSLPRTITVSISNLPTVYSTAASAAVTRYNALGLRIQFQIVNSGGDIQITGFDQGPSGGFITLGYSGFPSTTGLPYSTIGMNTNVQAYGANPNLGYVTGVIQHEIGHCIGLRHTDYFNRAYSCGGSSINEGNSYDPNDVQTFPGAVQIPGTPSAADANSFMLACSNGGDRTFNSNDEIALNFLYGTPSPKINGKGSYDWVNGTGGSGSGGITAPAGTLVHLTVSAYGPGTTTQCSISGAQLSVSAGNYVYMQNNTLTQTFTMPASGSVNWSGFFQTTGGAGTTGHISVY
ncbi:M57 family metalloprotease [Pedobacter nototheniae]|uniref:M57 family metalloprotease n=1 Tax=Pedobacter nototheniae TaxID=2488994 RepID=UPI00292DA1FA|nr:M57 family metalloprotease [Pedobacter nototheniae]